MIATASRVDCQFFEGIGSQAMQPMPLPLDPSLEFWCALQKHPVEKGTLAECDRTLDVTVLEPVRELLQVGGDQFRVEA
jgi:hypothetical protein